MTRPVWPFAAFGQPFGKQLLITTTTSQSPVKQQLVWCVHVSQLRQIDGTSVGADVRKRRRRRRRTMTTTLALLLLPLLALALALLLTTTTMTLALLLLPLSLSRSRCC